MEITCSPCEGTGTVSGGETCPTCGGDGKIDLTDPTFRGIPLGDQIAVMGQVWNDLLTNQAALDTKVDTIELSTNVFYSHVILEEIDLTEYSGLSDTHKDTFKIILMCGKVDLNEGKFGRVKLWSWFGAESTTVANLTALLT